MLWVDKYRPNSLDKLDYHENITKQLRALTQLNDFPHIIFYGPPGAGKKTRINCVLKELFGSGVEKMKTIQKEYQTPSGRKIDLNLVVSNYHIELNPGQVTTQDRVIIQNVIKEIAQTQQIDSSAQKKFKVVLLNEADHLSKDAQHALRRTMEKYSANLRLILCCDNTSKIISPIQSRCLLLRIAAPEEKDIINILNQVANKEGIKLPQKFAATISRKSNRNLRRALLMLETARVQQYPFSEDQDVILPDWETYIKNLTNMILQEQSPERALQVRGKLYELLTHCIPPTLIIKTLALELAQNVDNQLKGKIFQEAAKYEANLQKGNKAIFHIEAFVIKVMAIYKKYIIDMTRF